MKRTEKSFTKFLSSILIFLLFGNVAMGNITLGHDSYNNDQAVFTFQKSDQEKPFLFHEITIGKVSQTIPQNENFGFGLFGTFYSRPDYDIIKVSFESNSSYVLKDKRELIFQYLFPFHFFW